MKTLPKARKEKLVVRKFADELLVYDKRHHKGHCLNSTAAAVWQHCDGRKSVAEISRLVAAEMKQATPDARIVWYALQQFERNQLLEEQVNFPASTLNAFESRLSRREVIRALSITAVAALPLVSSMVAPRAAQAASCIASGQSCLSSASCCSGVCSANLCA